MRVRVRVARARARAWARARARARVRRKRAPLVRADGLAAGLEPIERDRQGLAWHAC